MGTALDSSNTATSSFEITQQTGVVPRAVAEIFRRTGELERLAGGRNNLRFEVSNSFVELYNEVRRENFDRGYMHLGVILTHARTLGPP